jgi:hypothetical protein
MVTKRYKFRPAWVLTLGPGLVLALAFIVLIAMAVGDGLISGDIALWLLILPGVILAGSYLRWLSKGSISIGRDQVVVRGPMTVTDPERGSRRVRATKYLPRQYWNSLMIEGVLFPTLTWTRFGETVQFGRVMQPHRIRKLLTSPEGQFGRGLGPTTSEVLLFGLVMGLKLTGSLLWRMTVALSVGALWLARWTWPHLKAAVSRIRGGASDADMQRVASPSASSLSLHDYQRFVAFCQSRFFGEEVEQIPTDDEVDLYLEVLERVHVVQKHVNGHSVWTLRPCIEHLDDITKRVSQQVFERIRLQSRTSGTSLTEDTLGEAMEQAIAMN